MGADAADLNRLTPVSREGKVAIIHVLLRCLGGLEQANWRKKSGSWADNYFSSSGEKREEDRLLRVLGELTEVPARKGNLIGEGVGFCVGKVTGERKPFNQKH